MYTTGEYMYLGKIVNEEFPASAIRRTYLIDLLDVVNVKVKSKRAE